ncbi:PTS transporter subunit EIIB [uncultured Klebsiella sp.]|uniref:PTS transporter subunit EIIB n=1 Tax=uncultured Klebsiella sp. TaxID=284011 RepID=UPI002804DCEA|nr:PTS transporter subunit EIIB [uncultured Klebsiella sp.]
MKYKTLASENPAGIGGRDNVCSVAHCTAWLRFTLKNYGKVNRGLFDKNRYLMMFFCGMAIASAGRKSGW